MRVEAERRLQYTVIMQRLTNPLGRAMPSIALVRMGVGSRTHIKHPDEPGTLCAPRDSAMKRWTANLRPVKGEVVDCYRCLKLAAINTNLRGHPLACGTEGDLVKDAYKEATKKTK